MFEHLCVEPECHLLLGEGAERRATSLAGGQGGMEALVSVQVAGLMTRVPMRCSARSKNSSANSGASNGSTQVVTVLPDFAFNALPHGYHAGGAGLVQPLTSSRFQRWAADCPLRNSHCAAGDRKTILSTVTETHCHRNVFTRPPVFP